jgi:hypothetical protein
MIQDKQKNSENTQIQSFKKIDKIFKFLTLLSTSVVLSIIGIYIMASLSAFVQWDIRYLSIEHLDELSIATRTLYSLVGVITFLSNYVEWSTPDKKIPEQKIKCPTCKVSHTFSELKENDGQEFQNNENK